MADEDLRELERTWRASGVLDDGIAWHRARLRAGVVDRDGLRREAAAGDRAAWAAADDVPSVLVRLDTWLRANSPDGLAGFNPPATEAEIAETEAAMGQPLPPLLRSVFLWRNGQARAWPLGVDPDDDDVDPEVWEDLAFDPDEVRAMALSESELAGFPLDPPGRTGAAPTVFPGHWFLLSLREVRSAWEVCVHPAQGGPERDAVWGIPWPEACVPFMRSGGGELRCVDPSGVRTRKGGQVVEGALSIERVVAPSLQTWLEVTVAALEQGVWRPEDADATRVDYFARAVTPGYPVRVLLETDPVFTASRARLDKSAGELVENWTALWGCLSFLTFPAAMVVTAVVALVRRGGDVFSLQTAAEIAGAVPAAILGSGLIAAPLVLLYSLHLRLKHRRYQREFANATLDPPKVDG